jgi:hypothetical protein
VDFVEGAVTVQDRARIARSVRRTDRVFEGETIVTGRDGEVHLAMEDGGYIAVRPNSNLSVVSYQANGTSDDKSVLSLLSGTFRSITGWIGKQNPRNYRVHTPTATIGVRGTDHEPLVIPEGSRDGEPGTYDKVNAGRSVIESRHGRVEVAPNQAAFAPLRGRPQPRLLTQIPAVFRPTRNEERLRDRHADVQRNVDRLREVRRQEIEARSKEINQKRNAVDDQRRKVDERKDRSDRHDKADDRKPRLDEKRERVLRDKAERDDGGNAPGERWKGGVRKDFDSEREAQQQRARDTTEERRRRADEAEDKRERQREKAEERRRKAEEHRPEKERHRDKGRD